MANVILEKDTSTLDANSHWRHTVRATGVGSLLSQNLKREENMSDIQLLNIDQVCEILNIGRVKAYELINRKKLKSIKIDARRLVSVRALNEFIVQLEEKHGT